MTVQAGKATRFDVDLADDFELARVKAFTNHYKEKSKSSLVSYKPVSDREVSDYFKWFEKTMNRELKGLAKIDCSEILENLGDLSQNDRNDIFRGEKDGIVHEDTIVAVCRAIREQIVVKNPQHISVNGLVQSGKTPWQVLTVLFGSIIKSFKFDKLVFPVWLVPNGVRYLRQFTTKFGTLWKTFNSVSVSACGKKRSLLTYFDKLQNERNHILDQAKKKASHELTPQEYNKLDDSIRTYFSGPYVVLPLSKQHMETFRYYFLGVISAGFHFVVDRDESHFAIQAGTINDKSFEEKVDLDGQLTDSIYSILQNNPSAQFIAVSATNWAARQNIFPLEPGQGYCGIPFGWEDENGIRFRVGLNVRLPKLMSLSSLGRILGIPASLIQPRWYHKPSSFLKHRGNYPELAKLNHDEYKVFCEVGIAKVIRYFLTVKSKHRGMLLRFVNDNDTMTVCIEKLQKLLPDITLVRDYGGKDAHEFSKVNGLLEHYGVDKDGRYVVIPTAGARMSDSFPAHCGYGVDFTEKSSYLAAILQGVLGRMSGYGKDPTVVLSDANHKAIERYIENDFIPPPGMKMLPDGTGRTLEKSAWHLTFDQFEDDEYIQELSGESQKLLAVAMNSSECARYSYKGKRKKLEKLNLGAAYARLHNSIDLKFDFDHLEKLSGERLLRPGETDQEGRAYEEYDEKLMLTSRRGGTENYGTKDKDSHKVLVRWGRIQGGKPVVVGLDFLLYRSKRVRIKHTENVCTKSERVK